MIDLQVAQQQTDRSRIPHTHNKTLASYKPFPGTLLYDGDHTKLDPKLWARFDLPRKMPSEVAHHHAHRNQHALGLRTAVRYGKIERRW